AAFFEREVGDKGIVLSTHLQNEFDRRLQSVSQALDKMQTSYNSEISHLKWFTEFGHLNRGDMLTSEQHRCHNEKKKFQRRV
ncbi:hypothetical protein G9445_16615, partial [Escherichia coli]|nr:hypothetical protein [Escherichia coli]